MMILFLNLNLFIEIFTLTSVSERIAKIFAIIVEKPGLRQLSAIKPNFNSEQKKQNKIN